MEVSHQSDSGGVSGANGRRTSSHMAMDKVQDPPSAKPRSLTNEHPHNSRLRADCCRIVVQRECLLHCIFTTNSRDGPDMGSLPPFFRATALRV